MQDLLVKLQRHLELSEMEREFYFNKLRDIELLCQDTEQLPVAQKIMDILYATQVSYILANVDPEEGYS